MVNKIYIKYVQVRNGFSRWMIQWMCKSYNFLKLKIRGNHSAVQKVLSHVTHLVMEWVTVIDMLNLNLIIDRRRQKTILRKIVIKIWTSNAHKN